MVPRFFFREEFDLVETIMVEPVVHFIIVFIFKSVDEINNDFHPEIIAKCTDYTD